MVVHPGNRIVLVASCRVPVCGADGPDMERLCDRGALCCLKLAVLLLAGNNITGINNAVIGL
ncbi:hypothetical protein B0T44_09595 [Nocardia donostiensis]|nr:hypothetical protein B0T36_24070 [Nocardia donostiensis]OQS20531.1 hypothetical protein B0T44_09595 [Nocardia donostiensis]